MAYMKKVANAATDAGYGAGWFKIQEAGLSACELGFSPVYFYFCDAMLC